MPPRQIFSRYLSAVIAALAVPAPSVLVGGQASAAIPPYTMEERAAAIAGPSMMYLESWVSGYLRRTDTGQALNATPIVLNYRCSGFVVSEAGHVITSTHCLQPGKNSYRGSAANTLANDRIKAGQLTADQRDAFIRDTVATTEFTGDNLVSAATVKVYGQLYQATGSLTTEPAAPAEIVEAQPYNDGDVTLLKFGLSKMPVVEFAPEPLTVNAPVVPIGFGTDNSSWTATYTVRSQAARITARQGDSNPPIFQIDRDPGPVARGGIVADTAGRINGMVTADLVVRDRPNKLVANLEHVKKLLADAGATNALSSTDQAYRAGLDAYFGGRYSEAIEKLDTVIAVMPEHAIAANYRRQAVERRAIEGETSPLLTGQGLIILLGALGVALLLCVLAILWLVVRSRARQRRAALIDPYAAPISALPVSAHPISAIPISGEPGGYQYLPLPPPQPLQSNPEDPDQQFTFGSANTEYGSRPGQDDDGRNPWGPPAAR